LSSVIAAGARAAPWARLLPAVALLVNAFVWGTSWLPFRRLEAAGLHPLWATTLVFTLASVLIVAVRPRALQQVLRTPALWMLVLAAGVTNASFNWAVVIGDVVRVVLLFYLMPLWSALLARLILNERLDALAFGRMLLALTGAAVVLWPEGAHGWAALPLPRSLGDWLGLLGGFSFALNNVMLRREADRPDEGRALAMFLGGALVAGTLAIDASWRDPQLWPPAPAAAWLAWLCALSVVFLGGNLALQYGAARLPAQLTSVVMLNEVLFASVSAAWLGAGTFSTQLGIGGALIVLSAVLAAIGPAPRPAPA
jgi:drug/metabolite transporter (DMT)-like permease